MFLGLDVPDLSDLDLGEDEDEFSERKVIEELFAEADRRRTAYDRVGTRVILGFLWSSALAPLGVAAAFAWRLLWKHVLRTWVPILHRRGVLEASAYLLALALAAQGLRFEAASAASASASAAPSAAEPARPPARSSLVLFLLGSLALTPCWAYSSHLRGGAAGRAPERADEASGGKEDAAQQDRDIMPVVAAGAVMQALALGLLLLAARCRALGFAAALAAYCAVVLAVAWGRGRTLSRGHAEALLVLCAEVSGAVAVAGALRGPGATRAFGLTAWPAAGFFRFFAEGAAFCGHVCYFVSIVLLSSTTWPGSSESFRTRQTLVLLSAALALALGWLLEAPGLHGAAFTCIMLWLLMKECEVKTSTVLQGGFKLAATVIILRYLYMNPEYVASSMDPQNLYI